ncbi:MAG: DUF58 domain-containing protein [Pseudomonadales bacterium]|nr:DUF58 domain-containing protein [Pseudomonadales bacterium]
MTAGQIVESDKSISKGLNRKFRKWLHRRIPPSESVKLEQKSIFVFPSQKGLAFCAVIALLLLTAINYQNNMIYLLTFLLASILIANILVAYSNLLGLTIQFGRVNNVYAGDEANFQVSLIPKAEHRDIVLRWQDDYPVFIDCSSASGPSHFSITALTGKRGRWRPGRLLIESFYPFGLIRVWSWVDLDCSVIVYPKPTQGVSVSTEQSGVEESDQNKRLKGGDDFFGIRDYSPGDPIKYIAWKRFAQRGELYVKEFEHQVGDPQYICFENYNAGNIELRLENMCFDLLAADKRNQPYGLIIGQNRLAPSFGQVHLTQCLELLALYGAETV